MDVYLTTPQQVAELQDSAARLRRWRVPAGAEPGGTTVGLTEGITLRAPRRPGEEHAGCDSLVWRDPVLMEPMANTVTETIPGCSCESRRVFADRAAQLQAEIEPQHGE